MLAKLRPRSAYDVMAALALFVALSTGGAYAANTVFSTDIVDGEVKTPDLASGSVNGTKVVDNSLTGADVVGKPGTSTAAAVNGSLTTDDIAGQQANAANATPFIDGTLTQWDIKNGAIAGADIASNAISGAKVNNNSLNGTDIADNSLTGVDVDESTLGQVPSAVFGGLGRLARGSECDPETEFFTTCVFTTIDLPAPTRVLLIGVAKAQPDSNASLGQGQCRLATHLADIPESTSGADTTNSSHLFVPLMAITGPVGPGPVDFAVRCNEIANVRYFSTAITAIAINGS
jgi:hypothetical protein